MKNLALIKCGKGYEPSIYVGKSYTSSKKIKIRTCLQARLNTHSDEVLQKHLFWWSSGFYVMLGSSDATWANGDPTGGHGFLIFVSSKFVN